MAKDAYRIETHAHTSEVSACSNLRAKELVQLHVEAGYDALVITDHYLHEHTNSERKRGQFLEGYLRAKEAGAARGLVVLPGMELRFNDGGWEDYLVYLPDEALFGELRGITSLNIRTFSKMARQMGLIVYQAHPFRTYLSPAPPDALDGVEVHNGNPHHDSHNDRALRFARQHGLRQLSGSDVHEVYGVGLGGIYVPERALTPKGFVEYLRETPKPMLIEPREETNEA